MESKTTKSKKNNFELIYRPDLIKKAVHWVKQHYIYVLAGVGVILLVILITSLFMGVSDKKKKETIKKYVIISYNKILYKHKYIKAPGVIKGITAYESGYLEKSKFHFQSALKQRIRRLDKKIALVNLANIFDDYSQYDRAVQYLKKAVEVDKRDGIIYHNLGIVYKHKKEYQNAVESLLLAVKYNKHFVKSYLSLASLYFYLHKYTEALKYYKKASNLNPANVEIKYNVGICYFKLNKTDEAMKVMQDIMKADFIPDKIKSESAKSLGVYFASKGDLDKSLFYFKKAAEIKEDYDVYYKLATLYKIQGDYEHALNYYSKAYKMNHDDAYTIKNLAELHYRFGDYDKALQYYKYMFDNFKAKSEVLLIMGELYVKKEDYTLALEYYNKALDFSPAPDEAKIAYVSLGNLYYKLKDYNEALKWYEKALEIDKLDFNIYYNIGLIHLENKDYNKALQNMDEVLKSNPDSIKLYLLKSKLLYRSGNTKLAIVNYNVMIEKFPKEILSYFELGNLYFRIKKYKKAQHYLIQAKDLNPRDDFLYKIYLNLAIINSENKDYETALSYINKAYVINNKDPLVNYNFGLIHFHLNEYNKARDYFYQTTRLMAQDAIKASAYLGLGNIYYSEKKISLAESMFKKSIKFNPNFTEARYNLKMLNNQYESKKNN